MDQHVIVALGLGCVALVCVVVALFPGLFSDDPAGQRQKSIASRQSGSGQVDKIRDPLARRKQVVDSLKDLDNRKASKRPNLEVRIGQAGLDWSKRRYWISVTVLGLTMGGLAYMFNGSPLIAATIVGIGMFGVPSWVLSYRLNKRLKQFRAAFPEALDMITRGVKAGLPLGDCLRMIAAECREPVRSEFRTMLQAQSIGIPVGEAIDRLAQRVPIPETNFFSIVINIQQKAGGNLSEALSNLARVLRERKKMEGKIKAMSAEAKASAGIIGALPFVVGTLVYLTAPDYMSLLFTTSTGHMVMAGALTWMGIGIFIIKKMVSFDF